MFLHPRVRIVLVVRAALIAIEEGVIEGPETGTAVHRGITGGAPEDANTPRSGWGCY